MKVEGEIFIVTQGRGNVKLGLVEVCAIPEKEMLDWIDAKQTKAKIELEKTKKQDALTESAQKIAVQEYQAAKAYAERVHNAWMANILNDSLSKAYESAMNEAAKKAELADKEEERVSKARGDNAKWTSPEFYQDGLRGCEVVSKTNSDGKFSLKLKQEKYALAAKSDRRVFNETEVYYWLIWVSPESVGNPLMLSNDNLMTAESPMNIVTLPPNA